MPYKNKQLAKEHSEKWRKLYPEKHRARVNKYRKEHPWIKTFDNIRRRCKDVYCRAYKWYGARRILCLITVDELKELWFKDKAYLLKQPSIDRINPDGNYEINNCRYIERKQNALLARRKTKITLQFNLKNKLIKEWKSVTEASKEMNINLTDISACARGEQKTAHGFIWRYKYEN
jgi:hypothetical protein